MINKKKKKQTQFVNAVFLLYLNLVVSIIAIKDLDRKKKNVNVINNQKRFNNTTDGHISSYVNLFNTTDHTNEKISRSSDNSYKQINSKNENDNKHNHISPRIENMNVTIFQNYDNLTIPYEHDYRHSDKHNHINFLVTLDDLTSFLQIYVSHSENNTRFENEMNVNDKDEQNTSFNNDESDGIKSTRRNQDIYHDDPKLFLRKSSIFLSKPNKTKNNNSKNKTKKNSTKSEINNSSEKESKPSSSMKNKTKKGKSNVSNKDKTLDKISDKSAVKLNITDNCLKNCSGKGICNSGECYCMQGYTNADCSKTYEDVITPGLKLQPMMIWIITTFVVVFFITMTIMISDQLNKSKAGDHLELE